MDSPRHGVRSSDGERTSSGIVAGGGLRFCVCAQVRLLGVVSARESRRLVGTMPGLCCVGVLSRVRREVAGAEVVAEEVGFVLVGPLAGCWLW